MCVRNGGVPNSTTASAYPVLRALERVWKRRDKLFNGVVLYEDLLLQQGNVESTLGRVGFSEDEVSERELEL